MVSTDKTQRATRFPIKTSLLFRMRGQAEWQSGSTVNLSRSGVLFRTDGPLPIVGQRIDFLLMLPLNGPELPPELRGTGQVVRTTPGSLLLGGHAVAVTIDDHAIEVRPPPVMQDR